MKLILGIDPGVKHIGLSVLNIVENEMFFTVQKELDLSKDLYPYGTLVTKINDLLYNHQFEVVAVEKPFFTQATLAKNIRTLEFIGLIKLAAENTDVPVVEYSPATIKKQVTGSGKAVKEDIIKVINEKFSLNITSSHIADAAAIAYTYYLIQYDSN